MHLLICLTILVHKQKWVVDKNQQPFTLMRVAIPFFVLVTVTFFVLGILLFVRFSATCCAPQDGAKNQ